MTHGQLELLNFIIGQVKTGKGLSISNDQKVDLDDMGLYFNNLTLDVVKQKKRGRVRMGDTIAYRLTIEVKQKGVKVR
jgi:hypothetical protein